MTLDVWLEAARPRTLPAAVAPIGVGSAVALHEGGADAALAEVAPLPAALLLFGEGLVHIHHAHAAHRLASEADGDAEARAMLAEITGKVDELPPERAQHLVQLLAREYGR